MNRYRDIKKINGKLKTTKFPKIQDSPEDIVIISKALDRLDILAQKYYGNQQLYWIIALANNLGKGTLEVPSGLAIRIPTDYFKIVNEYIRLNS